MACLRATPTRALFQLEGRYRTGWQCSKPGENLVAFADAATGLIWPVLPVVDATDGRPKERSRRVRSRPSSNTVRMGRKSGGPTHSRDFTGSIATLLDFPPSVLRAANRLFQFVRFAFINRMRTGPLRGAALNFVLSVWWLRAPAAPRRRSVPHLIQTPSGGKVASGIRDHHAGCQQHGGQGLEPCRASTGSASSI